jgi:hypothetical protein
MNREFREPASQSLFERWAPLGWAFFIALIAAEAARRWLSGEVSPDLSAYIAAAETFAMGRNPYGPQLLNAPSYGGYVFVYPPGSLPLIRWLALLEPRAVTLADGILHAGALLVSMAWLRRHFSLPMPLGWLAAMAVMLFWPATSDFISGNLVTYMFATFIGCMWLAYHPEPRPRHLLIALAFGLVLSIKPMWGVPAGLVFLARRRWGLAAALLGGAACMAALSLVPWHGQWLVDDWWARIQMVRAQYRSVDILSLAPALLPAAALLWAAAGALLLRRLGPRHPHLWLWSAASLIAWPRLGSYSYILAVPLLCYLWSRWGWKKNLALALPACAALHVFRIFLPPGQAEYAYLSLLYAWIWIVAALVFFLLWRSPAARSLGH